MPDQPGVRVRLRAPMRRAVGASLRRAAATRVGMRVLAAALKDDVLFRTFRMLSNHNAAAASFASMPPDLDEIEGFEDLWWLFAQNELSHGLSRLRLGEAAYIWHLAREQPGGQVAEVGRYRGGTAFLLAAAGAHVVTVDIDEAQQAQDVPDLEEALERVGLRDRVEIHVADATTFPVEPESFDMVILDAVWSRDALRAAFERWWPALRPGGDLVLRSIDPRDPGSACMIELWGSLAYRSDAVVVGEFWQWGHVQRIDPPENGVHGTPAGAS